MLLALAGMGTVPAASAADVGLNVHAGTLGLGLGLDIGVTDNVGVRLGFNRLDLTAHWDNDDLNYETSYDFRSLHALLDWHPFGGAFRVTGGVMTSDRKFKAAADVEAGDRIGDGHATRDGRLEGKVEYDDVAPYLGAGWDWHFGDSGLALSLDLGLLYQGSPDVSLKETRDTGASQQDISEERQDIDDEFSDYNAWPVAQIGLLYQF